MPHCGAAAALAASAQTAASRMGIAMQPGIAGAAAGRRFDSARGFSQPTNLSIESRGYEYTRYGRGATILLHQ